MNCKRVCELLGTGYIDGELSEAEECRISSHLEQCPSCSDYRELILSAVSPLRNAQKVYPSEAVWNRIQDLREASLKKASPVLVLRESFEAAAAFLRKPAWGAGVFAMMLLAAVGLQNMGRHQGSAPPFAGAEDAFYFTASELDGAGEDDENLGLGLELFLIG